MWWLAYHLVCLCSGCVGGSEAMRTVALWHHFLAVRSIRRRLASESRVPVGEVQRPPVIAMAAAL
jgi:hypothetical protein